MTPLEEIWEILGTQLTCIYTSEFGTYPIYLTGPQVERLKELLDVQKTESKTQC